MSGIQKSSITRDQRLLGSSVYDMDSRHGSVKPWHTPFYKEAHIMRYVTDHKQVNAYDETSGFYAVVDEGISDLLKAMWKLGLKTQYSCQGGERSRWKRDEHAYVLMSRKSGKRFEDLLRKKRDILSPTSQAVVEMFLDGPRMHDLSLSVRNFEYFRWMITPQIGLKVKPKPSEQYFSVERSYQLAPHWLRTTYRWPAFLTPHILDLLEELISLD